MHDFGVMIIKNPIASGGLCPPDPYTSVFRPTSQKILDLPMDKCSYDVGMIAHAPYSISTQIIRTVQHITHSYVILYTCMDCLECGVHQQ